MSKSSKQEAQEQRRRIMELRNQGKSYSQIESILGCSRRTIAKVAGAMTDSEQDPLEDGRTDNGRPGVSEGARNAVLAARDELGFGSLMLWAMMKREPEKYGIQLHELPSPASIGRILKDAALTVRMTGSKDRKFYPYEEAQGAGDLMMMDGWGPHHLTKGTKVYLATIKDHYSRMFSGVINITTANLNKPKGADSDQWVSAYYHGVEHFYGGEAPAVLQTDNGIGLAVAGGHLPQAARHALKTGSRLVYIPKAQPWRNGRLENTHWRMEREFWRRPEIMRITSAKEAIERYAGWVNFYNLERPQGSLKGQPTPAERAAGFMPVTADTVRPNTWETLEPQAGIMDCIRLVENHGWVDLWAGDNTRLQDVFMGQYVRFRFFIDPKASSQQGQVIWRSNHDDEPVVVATFNHRVEQSRKRGEPVISDIVYHDFDRDTVSAHSVRIDQVQHNNQVARITKRPTRTGGDLDYVTQEPRDPNDD